MRLRDRRAYAVYGRLLVEIPQVARGVHPGARDIPTHARGVQPTPHRGFTAGTPRTNSSEYAET